MENKKSDWKFIIFCIFLVIISAVMGRALGVMHRG